jgi:polysaccharide export outer membrane protein
MRARSWSAVIAIATTLAGTVQARADEYLIGVGDVLELSVVGVPELHYRSSVYPDGRASFPLIDDVAAEGRSLSDIRREVRAKLSRKVSPRSGGRGVEDTVSFSAEQINIAIAEYRPIYVSGQVAQPGEQKFRAGMTAREALAVAGGLSLLPLGASAAPGRASAGGGLNLQAEYGMALNELAREQIRKARLQAEYEGKNSAELTAETNGSSYSQVQPDIVRLETERMAGRDVGQERERAYLAQSAEKVEKHLALLTERRAKEAGSLEADQADLNRVTELFRSGITAAGRVSEARRTVLLSATQLLQTEAGIAAAERELVTIRRDTVRLDERRREAVLAELQETTLKVQNLQTKVIFTAQQLPVLSSPDQQSEASRVQVLIVRRRGPSREKVPADLDAELMPGDGVDIAMPLGTMTPSAMQR